MKTIVPVNLLPSAAEINQALQSCLRGVCVCFLKKKKKSTKQMNETRCTSEKITLQNMGWRLLGCLRSQISNFQS